MAKIDNAINEPRSSHTLSCNWTGTAEFGRLVPFHIEELVATDHVKTCRPKIELQMLPLASPTFGKIDIYVHYFFVPHRLTWKAYNDVFARQGVYKNDVFPFISLYDLAHFYQALPSANKRAFFKHWTSLGLPPFFTQQVFNFDNSQNDKRLTMLKFRAYQQIWWDFFRDPEVLRDESKANYINDGSGHWSSTGAFATPNQNVLAPKIRSIKDVWLANLFADSGYSPIENLYPDNAFLSDIIHDSDGQISYADSGDDFSRVSRKIEALTRLTERLTLGGKRSIDAMFAAYGVKPNFMKMQMAQYVGGNKVSVMISDITSSAETNINGDGSGLPLGAKAASGFASSAELDVDFTASEPGYLVGILSIMPHIHFNQGISKTWYRNSIDDFFNRSLERVGLVGVAKSEVGINSYNAPNYARAYDDNVFAYTQPYYEYKQGQDILAGDFAYYHNDYTQDDSGNVKQQLQYMHSMEMYIDFPLDRQFNADNLTVKSELFNKVFYYFGGSLWDDVDDHFHLCIDKEVVIDRPMDGFAIPTLETTQEPHAAKTNVGKDTVL